MALLLCKPDICSTEKEPIKSCCLFVSFDNESASIKSIKAVCSFAGHCWADAVKFADTSATKNNIKRYFEKVSMKRKCAINIRLFIFSSPCLHFKPVIVIAFLYTLP